jgi:hypothetical protein
MVMITKDIVKFLQIYSSKQLKYIGLAAKANLDMSYFEDPEFDHRQMKQIYKGLSNGIDVSDYALKKFNYAQMYFIRLGKQKGFDVSIYADTKFKAEQMEQIYYGMMNDVDVSIYADPEYSWRQMKSLCDCLKEKIDVSTWADPKNDMVTFSYNYFNALEKFVQSEKIDNKIVFIDTRKDEDNMLAKISLDTLEIDIVYPYDDDLREIVIEKCKKIQKQEDEIFDIPDFEPLSL